MLRISFQQVRHEDRAADSQRRPERGRTALPEQRKRQSSSWAPRTFPRRHAATEVPEASGSTLAGTRSHSLAGTAPTPVFVVDTVYVPTASRGDRSSGSVRLNVGRNEVAQPCRNSANASLRRGHRVRSHGVTRRPKFRKRPQGRPERGRSALPERRKRQSSSWTPCTFPRRHAATEVPAASAFARAGLQLQRKRQSSSWTPCTFPRRHAATEVPAASAFARSGLQRTSVQTPVFVVDTVYVPTGVTRRPKFRQRRRLLVPAYGTLKKHSLGMPRKPPIDGGQVVHVQTDQRVVRTGSLAGGTSGSIVAEVTLGGLGNRLTRFFIHDKLSPSITNFHHAYVLVRTVLGTHGATDAGLIVDEDVARDGLAGDRASGQPIMHTGSTQCMQALAN